MEQAFEELAIGQKFIDSETQQTWIKVHSCNAARIGVVPETWVMFEPGEQVVRFGEVTQ